MTRLRIGFLVPSYKPDSTSNMPVAMRALADAGVTVDVIRPIRRVIDVQDVRVEHDLYVLKKKNGLALSLAGALHAHGAAIVNPYPTTVVLNDKIVTFRILQAAGVATPATYAASCLEQLAPLLEAGPLIIKPNDGDSGYGIRVVRTVAELMAVPCPEPIFAQRHHAHSGRDRKMYLIGDQVFGVKKVFPARTEAEKHGEPFSPTREHREIVLRCAAALGVDLCGVDIIETAGGAYVVDVSSIPGFKGVPEAGRLLANYFRAAAERATRGASAAAFAPSRARHPDDDPEALRRLVAEGSALDLVLHALSTTPTTPAQLEQVRRLLEEKTRPGGRSLP